MIKFINKNGHTFFGEPPYIHWFGDNDYDPESVDSSETVSEDVKIHTSASGQSINLQYIKNILIISDSSTLTFKTSTDGIFKLVDVTEITDESVLDDLIKDTITLTGVQYSGGLYLYQLIVNASTSNPGQYTDTIIIEESNGQSQNMTIGADFYDYDEIMSINLGNRGTEIPESIQKAIYGADIQEAYVDNILINRKFKELISNYLDIMDNRGSYKSLWNSLEWFEWGENVNLLEIWRNEDGYFEKDLENILSEQYRSLFTTHQKTTYLALEAALHGYKMEDGSVVLDDEKNPVLEDITRMWSNDVLGLKISLLGAFFERYFMPIHLTLKNATVQARVFTNMMKVKHGALQNTHHWHDDWGVVDIKMPHTVTLGSLQVDSNDPLHKVVGVGSNTPFGYKDIDSTDVYYVNKIVGVDYLEDITARNLSGNSYSNTDQNELKIVWGNIRGHVGVVVPIEVTIPLPEGDAISEETIVIYRYSIDGTPGDDENPVRVFERRLYSSVLEDGKYVAKFAFKLFSTIEEKVSFSLQLHSLSGHTWTAASSYEAIDTNGFRLSAYRVSNKEFDNVFYDSSNPTSTYWASWNPYEGQWNTIENDDTDSSTDLDPNKYYGKIIRQYIPCRNTQLYLNELVVVKFNNESAATTLDTNVGSEYYIIKRNHDNKYFRMYIRRKSGKRITEDLFDGQNIQRRDYIFIPQLHEYTSIEDIPLSALSVDQYGRYKPDRDDYLVDSAEDLICVIPEFKYSKKIDISSISWIFENKTTHETIEMSPQTQPVVAYDHWETLTPGYWSVTMTFNYIGEGYKNKITRNSLFLVQKIKDD